MRVWHIVMILFLILLVGGGIATYYFYEKPIEAKQDLSHIINFSKMSILAKNSSNSNIVLNYSVIVNNSFYSSGNTLKEVPILDKVPTNKSFSVYFFDENNTYYSSRVDRFSYASVDTQNIMAFPDNVGVLWVNQTGSLKNDNNVDLTLSSQGIIKYISFCLSWSTKIIRVSTPKILNQMDIPNRYSSIVDRCFQTNVNLSSSSYVIPISYEKFGILDARDYIKFYIMDGDQEYNGTVITERRGKDIGMEDAIYSIK